MYATFLLVFLSAASAFPSSVPQECMAEIMRKYTQQLALAQKQAPDHAAIMRKVMEQIDATKCQSVRFRIDMKDTENPAPGNSDQRISDKQPREPDPHEEIPEKLHGESTDKIECKRDTQNEKGNVSQNIEHEAYIDQPIQNNHNFQYDKKNRDIKDTQHSYTTNDRINQFYDEEENDNIDKQNTYNHEKYSKRDEGKTVNDEAVTYSNVKHTYYRPNADHINSRQPYMNRHESSFNDYNNRQSQDTQDETNINYYTYGESNDRRNMHYHNVKQTDSAQGSSDTFVNNYNSGEYDHWYEDSNEKHHTNDYVTKETYDSEETNASNDERKSKYVNQHNFADNHPETTTYHKITTTPNNDNNINYVTTTTDITTYQATDRYGNQDKEKHFYHERSIEKDYTVYNAKSSRKASNYTNLNRYEKPTEGNTGPEKPTEKNISPETTEKLTERNISPEATERNIGSETTEKPTERNIGLEATDKPTERNIGSEGTEKPTERNIGSEGTEKPTERNIGPEATEKPTKRNIGPEATQISSERIIGPEATEKPTEGNIGPEATERKIGTKATEKPTERNIGPEATENPTERNISPEATPAPTERNIRREAIENSTERNILKQSGNINNKNSKYDTSTVGFVRETSGLLSTESYKEYNTHSETKQEEITDEIQTKTTSNDNSERKSFASDTGQTKNSNFDGSEKGGINSTPETKYNDQIENNLVIDNSMQIQKQNFVPNVAYSSKVLFSGNANQDPSVVIKSEIYGDQYQKENAILSNVTNFINTINVWIVSFIKAVNASFNAGG